MTARIRGAHAPRVLAMAFRDRELFSGSLEPTYAYGWKMVSGRAPKPARAGACAPRITAAAPLNRTR
jgi:hypothetical protein